MKEKQSIVRISDWNQIMSDSKYLIKRCNFLVHRMSWKVLEERNNMIKRLL